MKKLLIAVCCLLLFPAMVFANANVELSITYTGPGGVVEDDFVGFKIYREGVFVHESADGSPTHTWMDVNVADPSPTGGSYTYEISAYDSDGNESDKVPTVVSWEIDPHPGPPQGLITVTTTVTVAVP